jgi:hypothetical protein
MTAKSLQDLHDFYLSSRPNAGKVQTASKLLIRLCRQLNLESPEKIIPVLYEDIPAAIDAFHKKDRHKAIQDKSILAEMIGRYGPKHGWERVLEIFLDDPDSNLNQFAFQALEYCGKSQYDLVIPYIEKYAIADNELMNIVAAKVFSKIYTPDNHDKMMQWIKSAAENKQDELLENLLHNAQKSITRKETFTQNETYPLFVEKLELMLNSG